MKSIKYIAIALFGLCLAACDDADDLLNQYVDQGPIVYAGKIDTMGIQSGYYRTRVNIFPAEDVNRAYCVLSWNLSAGVRDSVKVEYADANFDEDMGCYYAIIPFESVEGNLLISSQNVDVFGNRSLINSQGAFIYGDTYVSTLVNAPVHVSRDMTAVVFEEKIGAVGNYLSYQLNDGSFTEEVLVTTSSYPLVDAMNGGIIRTKTRYLITDTDLDTLLTDNYLETPIEYQEEDSQEQI